MRILLDGNVVCLFQFRFHEIEKGRGRCQGIINERAEKTEVTIFIKAKYLSIRNETLESHSRKCIREMSLKEFGSVVERSLKMAGISVSEKPLVRRIYIPSENSFKRV